MKQRLIAAFLCLALLCALLPGTALAAGTTVRIAGALLNSTTPYFYLDGTAYRTNGTLPATVTRYAYFDTANDVLQLVDLTVSINQPCAIEIQGDIKIKLVGNSTVTSFYNDTESTYGIHCSGALTVTGSGMLTATGGTTTAHDARSYGVYATGSITVNGGTLNGTGGTLNGTGSTTTALDVHSYGVYAESGSITVKSGTLKGKGGSVGRNTGSGSSAGVYAPAGSITVEGGTLKGEGATGGPNSYGVLCRGAGSITVTGGVCDGAGEYYGVCCAGGGGITVTGGTLKGTAKDKSSSNYGVYCLNSVTISGTGKVEAEGVGTNDPYGKSYGVSAPQITVSGDGFLRAYVDPSVKRGDDVAALSATTLTTGTGLLALGKKFFTDLKVVYDHRDQYNYPWVEVNKVGVTVTPSTSFPAGNAGMNRTVTVDSGVANFNATNNYGGATLGGRALDLGTGKEHGSVEDGSIVITLNAAYLNTLTPGTYPLVVTLKDGTGVSTGYAGKTATTNIVVTDAPPVPPTPPIPAAAVPKTGDGSAPLFWLGLALLAGAGLLLSRTARKRKETR